MPKEYLRSLCDRIVHAQKPIRVLRAINWDPHVHERFFKAGEEGLEVHPPPQLAVRAIKNVAATGDAVVKASASLGVKDVACAGSAASASVKAAASMSVSVNASVSVTSSCTSHAS